MFERKRGTIIESTAALEQLLVQTDLDATLTMGMLALPFAAQYVRFGTDAAKFLRWPGHQVGEVVYDGVFCFLSQSSISRGGGLQPHLELIFVGKDSHDVFGGFCVLRAPIGAADGAVVEWVDAILTRKDGPKYDESDKAWLQEAVNFVVKLLLYMGLKDARQVKEAPYAQALMKLENVGPKKRAKATL